MSCKNIKGTTFAGSGSIRWASDGSNAGVITKVILRVKFNSLTQIQFSGQVTSTYLHGGKIKGTATIPPNLRSAGDNGGTCANSLNSRVKKLDWTPGQQRLHDRRLSQRRTTASALGDPRHRRGSSASTFDFGRTDDAASNQPRVHPERHERSWLHPFSSRATVAAMPSSIGAAGFVQRCVAPLPTAQSGRQDIVPGINGLATAQKVTSKVNLFQCSDTKKTGRSGILSTTLKSGAAHVHGVHVAARVELLVHDQVGEQDHLDRESWPSRRRARADSPT